MTEDSAEDVYDEELTTCPECGAGVHITEPIESASTGVAFGYIACEECEFSAREEWVHDRTERVDNE